MHRIPSRDGLCGFYSSSSCCIPMSIATRAAVGTSRFREPLVRLGARGSVCSGLGMTVSGFNPRRLNLCLLMTPNSGCIGVRKGQKGSDSQFCTKQNHIKIPNAQPVAHLSGGCSPALRKYIPEQTTALSARRREGSVPHLLHAAEAHLLQALGQALAKHLQQLRHLVAHSQHHIAMRDLRRHYTDEARHLKSEGGQHTKSSIAQGRPPPTGP